MRARGSLAACFLAVLWSLPGHLPSASAHVTFKLPSLPGVSPGNAGGYVPFDGNYLSNSPFMLNVPHSKPGNMTIGLQCSVPLGVSATPQEVAGYDLTLGFTATGAVANFTYTINPDAMYPNGWSQPATNYANANTLFSIFVGVSITATSCTFSDAANTAIVAGYPTLYFPCAEVVIPATTILNTSAALLAAPRFVLLWTQTAASSTMPAAGSSFALDGGATVQGCTSWPCSATAPFGGATATVLEATSAASIMLIPQGCVGATCTAVNGSIPAPFTNCPAGQVTVLTLKTGNNTAARAAAVSSPPSPASTMSNSSIVAWLAVLTAVFSFFFIGQFALALHSRITHVADSKKTEPAVGKIAEAPVEAAAV